MKQIKVHRLRCIVFVVRVRYEADQSVQITPQSICCKSKVWSRSKCTDYAEECLLYEYCLKLTKEWWVYNQRNTNQTTYGGTHTQAACRSADWRVARVAGKPEAAHVCKQYATSPHLAKRWLLYDVNTARGLLCHERRTTKTPVDKGRLQQRYRDALRSKRSARGT